LVFSRRRRELEAAIEELEEHGFDRAEISLLASEEVGAAEAWPSLL
jgi:hypothetical protein